MPKLQDLKKRLEAKPPKPEPDKIGPLVDAVNAMAKGVSLMASEFVLSNERNAQRFIDAIATIGARESQEIEVKIDKPDMEPLIKAIGSLEQIVNNTKKSGNLEYEIVRDENDDISHVRVYEPD